MVNNAGSEFMRDSYYDKISVSPQEQGIPLPPLESSPPEGAELIPITSPDMLHFPPADLRAMVEMRRTLRSYADTPLTFNELSYFLWMTAGVQRLIPNKTTVRTVPAAGGKHAIDHYLMINHVEGLKPSIYRYYALESALHCQVQDDKIAEKLMDATRGQKQVLESAVTFIWAAVFERLYWRYAERGYRYVHLDAGHICQNLYLAATQLNCGVCAIAAFRDEDVNALIDVDGESKFAIYLASLGKRNPR